MDKVDVYYTFIPLCPLIEIILIINRKIDKNSKH